MRSAISFCVGGRFRCCVGGWRRFERVGGGAAVGIMSVACSFGIRTLPHASGIGREDQGEAFGVVVNHGGDFVGTWRRCRQRSGFVGAVDGDAQGAVEDAADELHMDAVLGSVALMIGTPLPLRAGRRCVPPRWRGCLPIVGRRRDWSGSAIGGQRLGELGSRPRRRAGYRCRHRPCTRRLPHSRQRYHSPSTVFREGRAQRETEVDADAVAIRLGQSLDRSRASSGLLAQQALRRVVFAAVGRCALLAAIRN